MTDEGELFRRAATGNTCALVLLSELALLRYRQGFPEAVGGAEVFLRLAAANDGLHRLKLASFLLGRGAELSGQGDAERGKIMQWQAAEIFKDIVAEGDTDALSALVFALQNLADTGDERAAVELNSVMEAVGPDRAASVRAEIEQVTRR